MFLNVKILLTKTPKSASFSLSSSPQPYKNILILDHLNINHEQKRHDLLKAFYFNFLKCGIDPRKAHNIIQGRKILWANIGAQQLHLPEGKPNAQVLNGKITLGFKGDVKSLIGNYNNDSELQTRLKGSKFEIIMMEKGGEHGDSYSEILEKIIVKDPWGNEYNIVSTNAEKDERGVPYNRAKDLGVTYVNPRFSRKAYEEEEVVDDCMFRCLEIIDPENV